MNSTQTRLQEHMKFKSEVQLYSIISVNINHAFANTVVAETYKFSIANTKDYHWIWSWASLSHLWYNLSP
jgi:hypothetical protein